MAVGDVRTALCSTASFACASFDGVDDYIKLNSQIQELIIGNSFTISLFFKCNVLAADENLFSQTINTNERTGIYIESGDSSIRAGQYNGTSFVGSASTTSGISLNRWYHVLYTMSSGTTGKLYLDGVLQNGTQNTSTINSTTYSPSLGSRADGLNPFNGFIRDFRIYNRVLTTSEISNLSNSLLINNGLLYHYKLNGDALDSIKNISGTVSGATFVNDNSAIDIELTAARATANDLYFMVSAGDGNVLTTQITES